MLGDFEGVDVGVGADLFLIYDLEVDFLVSALKQPAGSIMAGNHGPERG